MPKKRKKQKPSIQMVLFSLPVEESRSPGPGEVIPLDFETHAVRMIMLNGQPWWVAADVCRALDVGNASLAVNGRADRPDDGLDDDEKGIATVNTPSGSQEMLVVNQFGVFQLILKSRKPEAKRFKRWLTHDVLPSIQKTGSYSVNPKGRIAREAKRLGCSLETAKVRCDQFEMNKAVREEFLADGGCVNDIVNYHEIAYRNEFGKSAAELRSWVGAKPSETPLDYMTFLPLSINQHSKAIAAKMIEVAEESGVVVSPAMRVQWLGDIVTKIKNESLNNFSGAEFQVVEDHKRGRVIDLVVSRSLN